MNHVHYVAPQLDLDSFNCPHCGAYAHQIWNTLYILLIGRPSPVPGAKTSQCHRCQTFAFWLGPTMIYPGKSTAPTVHPDAPADVKADYEEARNILRVSPRGAAALLRLALQKVTIALGKSGRDLNSDIAALVREGLSPQIQQALDAMRVVGNEAVHPGVIDLRDDPALAESLFGLVNIVVDVMIAQPKRINELYGKLPEQKRTAIQQRDSS